LVGDRQFVEGLLVDAVLQCRVRLLDQRGFAGELISTLVSPTVSCRRDGNLFESFNGDGLAVELTAGLQGRRGVNARVARYGDLTNVSGQVGGSDFSRRKARRRE
jgi:hypothetical protein